MKVAVYGGTGFVGSSVCKALFACGCAVTSISRTGTPPARFDGESWVTEVNWIKANASEDGAAASALPEDVDTVISCIGDNRVMFADADGWSSGWGWSSRSRKQYNANYVPNVNVVEAAKSAGAQRFVYVGVSSDCEQGFGGAHA